MRKCACGNECKYSCAGSLCGVDLCDACIVGARCKTCAEKFETESAKERATNRWREDERDMMECLFISCGGLLGGYPERIFGKIGNQWREANIQQIRRITEKIKEHREQGVPK